MQLLDSYESSADTINITRVLNIWVLSYCCEGDPSLHWDLTIVRLSPVPLIDLRKQKKLYGKKADYKIEEEVKNISEHIGIQQLRLTKRYLKQRFGMWY